MIVAVASLALASSAAAADFAVTPYVQHPSTNAMSILFFTTERCSATTKVWRADGKGATNVQTSVGAWAAALTNNLTATKSSSDKSLADKSIWNNRLYRHRVRFEGLEPNRRYAYEVGLEGQSTYTNVFRTAPGRDTPVRFISYADCETTAEHFANYTTNLKRMQSRAPDFITASGDLIGRGGIQSYWDEFWKQNAGGNGIGYTDILGGVPLLMSLGNHDLMDNGVAPATASSAYHDMQGEPSTERWITYFEFASNGVDFAQAEAPHRDARDMSQLFHRLDYGPVTLIFLDTMNGRDGDTGDDHDHDTCCYNGTSSVGWILDRRKGSRHPDFNVGSPQYVWLTNNLADAQLKSRFTFVLNHHCPFSRGRHNRDWRDGENWSAKPLRFLTETFVRYGVDAWICGHDELLEHSITNGWEILPTGGRRKHTLNVYDLGCSGDDPRTSTKVENPLEYFIGTYGSGDDNFGFLETDVTTNASGRWTCTMTPVSGSSGGYVSAQIVLEENAARAENANDLVYAQVTNASWPIDGTSHTKPADWLAYVKPPECPDEEPPEVLEHPTFVPFTQVTRTADGVSDEKVASCFTNGGDVVYSLLSERGRRYALGTNGVAVGTWVTGDGTPQLLRAPKSASGTYQVLTKEFK